MSSGESKGSRYQFAPVCTLDASLFIAALLKGDPRHAEAQPLVEQARRGELPACTTVSILSEVYGTLTWERAVPRHDPNALPNKRAARRRITGWP